MTQFALPAFYVGCLLCLLSLTACKSRKNSQQSAAATSSAEPVIRLEKGACFGTCPVFALDIYEDGRVDFLPRLFTAVDTAATARWEVGPILAAFEEAGLDDMKDEYRSPIADLPTYSLRYRDKTVKWNAEAPDKLYELMTLLDRLAGLEGWLHLDSHLED